MNFPERVIYSSTIVPKDPEHAFNRFVKKLTSKKISYYTITISMLELGPRKKLSTRVQVVGLINMTFHFNIRYIVDSSKLDLGYEVDTEYFQWVPKATKRAGEKQITSAILLYIIQAFNKSIEAKEKKPKVEKVKEKKPKEEKDKKPKDKEKKPKEKEKKPIDPLKLLKLKFVEGEISEEEYLRKKEILQD